MILSNGQFLDSVKFSALILDQATAYQNRLPLRFLNRTVEVNADDDEITATFTGKVFMADIVADDQQAAVYEAGKLDFVTNIIPNLKVGKRFSQGMINRLNRIAQNANVVNDAAFIANWEVQAAKDLIRAIDERKNSLLCAMFIDSAVYNRNGIVIAGTWGTPSDLLATPSTLWTSTSATPITDILTMKQHSANTYGEVYDRLTLSTADFLNAAATTEFKNLIPGLVNSPLATTAFNTRDPRNVTFFSALTGMTIELEDKTGQVQNQDGTTTVTRTLPLGKVIMDTVADDKNQAAHDFANAVVTEAVVSGLVEGPSGLFGTGFGPIGYYTGNENLNPPNLIAWGVQRGFPRKNRKTMCAVLTVQ